jgi:hypothetical protein
MRITEKKGKEPQEAQKGKELEIAGWRFLHL